MFDKLKSLFVVDDEEFKRKAAGIEDSQPTSEKAPHAPVDLVPQQEVELEATSAPGGIGNVSEKFSNILFGALQKADQAGFDYLEYRTSLNSLKKMDMDEPTRYKSAFAMAQTMKVDANKLVSSAQFYLQVLSNEEQKFGQALTNQRDKQVGEKQTMIKNLDQSIRAKAEQIKKLSAEIEKEQAKMKQLESDLQGAAGKVEQTKRDFIASYQAIVGQIQSDVAKMKQYLK